jgi:glycosyltransferase involved in cell wall biosynthesis
MISAPCFGRPANSENVSLPPHVLVLEPEPDGHHREWLEHLLRHQPQVPDPPTMTILVAPELSADLTTAIPAAARHRIRIVPLGAREHRLCTSRFLPLSGFARWWTMRRYLRCTGADVGHYLSLDLLSLPLALGLGAAGRQVGGILFRPSVHYRGFGYYRPTFRERLRDLRKDILYRRLLRNRSVGSVLTIDPYFPQHACRHYRQGTKVASLPDPAYFDAEMAMEPLQFLQQLRPARLTFLLFGVLTDRKGILTLLDALRSVGPKVVAEATFIVAGRVDPALTEAVYSRLARLAAERPDLSVHLEDRRLSIAEIAVLVEGADVVLAPYKRFVGSSGVLLWAARANRPLLAQDFGLVGRLVRENKLGLTADTSTPGTLAAAIDRMVQEGPASFLDRAAAQRFIADRTPENFAASVFASMALR